jgi:signal transduction histidine kinase
MVQGYPQFDDLGQIVRVIVVFGDVTAQRQTEQLRVAKEAAETASKAKSVFLSRVSHELRTPLNAINGFSELMLIDEQVPPSVKDKVRHVLNAGRHLLALINQILDLTRIESGQIRNSMQPVNLGPLLQECIDICGPLAQGRDVRLILNPPAQAGAESAQVWVAGDDTHLRQVLINLMSNAIKYNRPQGQVGVEVEKGRAADGGPEVIVSITDTGAGLSPEQIDSLFQPFNRLGAEYSAVEGHGLGLSISRLLAQSMSGDISVSSVVGRGSCFSLHLRGSSAP